MPGTGCTAASTSEVTVLDPVLLRGRPGQDYAIIERAGGMESLVVVDGDG